MSDSHIDAVLEYIKYYGTGSKNESEEAAGSMTMTIIPEFKKTVDKVIVDRYNPNRQFKITRNKKVDKIDLHILCCIIKNCQLNPFKLREVFRALSSLHESDAMIALHDIQKIETNIIYTTRPKSHLQIIPLNCFVELTIPEIIYNLRKKSEDFYRRIKAKRLQDDSFEHWNLDQGDELACLEDENGLVLSVPPIVRCDETKVS